MTNTLKDELDAIGRYSIISREEIEALANRLALQQKSGNCTTSDCLADMGKALGTKLMVYGSISKVGGTYALSLRLLDTDNKEAVRRVNERCKCSEEDLFDTIQLAAGKLLAGQQNIQRQQSSAPMLVSQQDQRESAGMPLWIEPSTGLEFVRVPGGCYSMGGKSGGEVRIDREVVTLAHKVCVDDFYLAKHEMNQKTWEELMGGNPAKHSHKTLFGTTDATKYPVDSVNWNEIQEFIKKLNMKAGMSFRLPTEAEWEYAARSGGKNEIFSGGNDYGEVSWGGGGDPWATTGSLRQTKYFSNGTTHEVDTKKPNGLGIYLMSGNVAEWCSDWFEEDYYKISPERNPPGPENGVEKIIRGGSWHSDPSSLMTFDRYHATPDTKNDQIGFRLAHPIF
ncbi:MAG: SUMF1/EgtB/PvdO family nonheme iron enzyme [Proteobacteria bacterium]|nr:SUMF1/EgtB/PvdO family nonheme iron enzyme [Pseudomonadota bacterium]MBU1738151.1 SUMF1/EgtB/PvdO family nonheme iron enzyme [Pseudomonadota bacterium]